MGLCLHLLCHVIVNIIITRKPPHLMNAPDTGAVALHTDKAHPTHPPSIPPPSPPPTHQDIVEVVIVAHGLGVNLSDDISLQRGKMQMTK